MEKSYCHFYSINGSCKNGDKCKFYHGKGNGECVNKYCKICNPNPYYPPDKGKENIINIKKGKCIWCEENAEKNEKNNLIN